MPGGRAYSSLQKADAAWRQLCEAPHTPITPPRQVIREVPSLRPLKAGVEDFDVVVLGGTLGIFQAAALALRGVGSALLTGVAWVRLWCSWQLVGSTPAAHELGGMTPPFPSLGLTNCCLDMCTPAYVQMKVAVIERNKVVGREQEWNIGRKEMKVSVLAAASCGCAWTRLWRIEAGRHGHCRWTAQDTKMCSLQVVYTQDVMPDWCIAGLQCRPAGFCRAMFPLLCCSAGVCRARPHHCSRNGAGDCV